jgi:hypothetical protein
MKRVTFAFALCALATGGAMAQPGGAGPFGIGIIIGEPTGIDAKYYLSRENAIEAAAAWSLESDNTFQIQVDYLFHKYDLIKVEQGELPLYFGFGGRLAIRENEDDLIGIRFPVGLDYNFAGAPIDIFGAIVPILELAPSTDFELEGAIGARFFF